MKARYDLVVCGGGPAGSSAALAAARQGLSVAVLEKESHPRHKLCGGLLTWKTMRLLEEHFGLDAEALRRADALSHVSDQYGIRSRHRLLAQGRLSHPFHFIRRAPFDALLAKAAKSAGVRIFDHCRVSGCDCESGAVQTSQGTFYGHVVLGADGVSSSVRRCMPDAMRSRQRWKRYLAPAMEGYVPRDEWPGQLDRPELYIGFLDAGYGWVFPNRDRVLVGMCGLRRGKRPFTKNVEEYLDFLGVQPEDIREMRGHPLPYGNWLSDPARGRVLLAGDAAGIVEPLFGEGLFFAMASGRCAGLAAHEQRSGIMPADKAYRETMNREIIPELRGSERLRAKVFRGFKLAGDGGFGLILRAFAGILGDVVHGKRSYRTFRKTSWDFRLPSS
ncbi:geranylgeranyl reductase family protein [Desulfovibrio oxyclinae]|uniref:geranylgeranyl reductase family protein n=1 Tax=Desulfovibrio oxyclinae TaxID=63560 RepID=UPI000377D995|nr:geranylgeranyl reductase family protein [Desulfovibrio oxyclinae]